jgi:CTP synthase (UTP-ammonia lyase)
MNWATGFDHERQAESTQDFATAWASLYAALPKEARLTVIQYSDEEMTERHCYRYEVNARVTGRFLSYCNNNLAAALRSLTAKLRGEE